MSTDEGGTSTSYRFVVVFPYREMKIGGNINEFYHRLAKK
jgi:hypothetical protein